MTRPNRPKATATPEPKAITTLGDLTPDPRNARRHTPRNVGMIADALHEVGAARSIVIDEDGVVLAGNATIEAAADAGLSRVQVVDGDGETIIAVRRTGLTAAQKTRLALYDNRAAELADGWDTDALRAIQADGIDLSNLFHDDELNALLGEINAPVAVDPELARRTLAERFGVPPFSVLDARQGYWQTRKRAWLALGIQSELGRGGDGMDDASVGRSVGRSVGNASPGGSARPACDYSQRERGDGRGRPIRHDACDGRTDGRTDGRLTWVAGSRPWETLDEVSRKILRGARRGKASRTVQR